MLEFHAVEKQFGPVRALDSCSFVAHRGRLTGFLGPNGAGETTAMRAVFGLVELDRGSVTWTGSPISAEARRRFGYMPEERGLYPRMEVAEQLVYLGRLCGRSSVEGVRGVDRGLERLGLTDRRRDRRDSLSPGNHEPVQLVAARLNEP